MTNQPEKWEEEFEKSFYETDAHPSQIDVMTYVHGEDIKDFITNLLKAERARVLEEVIEVIEEERPNIHQSFMGNISVEWVKKMDILTKLNNMKE